jgi:hypothetical protein
MTTWCGVFRQRTQSSQARRRRGWLPYLLPRTDSGTSGVPSNDITITNPEPMLLRDGELRCPEFGARNVKSAQCGTARPIIAHSMTPLLACLNGIHSKSWLRRACWRVLRSGHGRCGAEVSQPNLLRKLIQAAPLAALTILGMR